MKFRKERLSRMARGAMWSILAVVTAPEVADVIEFNDPLVKTVWAAAFTAAASWLTSTTAKRFGNPEDTLFR